MTQPLRILLIDNEKSFPDAAQTYARLNGWVLNTAADPATWQTPQPLPDIVLLDYALGNGGGETIAWVNNFKSANLHSRTWLISVDAPNRLEFVRKHGLAGFIRKPVDLTTLPDLINAQTGQIDRLQDQDAASENEPLLLTLAKKLQPAIDIIDVGDLSVSWSNHDKPQPLSAHDWTLIRLLEAELLEAHKKTGKAPASVQRLDWDAAHQPPAFRHTRLYPVGEYYWLTRDWHEGETLHDAELFNLERHANLAARLYAAAMYLARRYGITRLRVYKIARLPFVVSFEDDPGPFVMPVFQRGGGFAGSPDDWRTSGFMMAGNPNTQRAAEPGYVCAPDSVQGDEPVGNCTKIQYGTAGTRAQFPIRDKHDQLRALLAFDRRTDHFDQYHEDAELAGFATRLYGVFDGPLSRDDIDAMRGLLADLGERLLGWLDDDEHERERGWHKVISDCLLKTLTQTARPRDAEPFETLSAICASFLDSWKKQAISGQVWGEIVVADAATCAPGVRPDPLCGWYIALAIDADRWQAIAGSGAIYEAYAQHGWPLPLLDPQRQALANELWAPCMIQDFQAWRRRDNAGRQGVPPDEYSFLGAAVDAIGAWLAVPMDIGGGERALMIVHSPYRFHFTPMRCRLLVDAARRLLPPLVSALQESKTRGAFVGAVMHDVKNDAAAALWNLESALATPADPAITQDSLMMVRHYLQGLEQLGLDFLHVVRPGGGIADRFQSDLELALKERQTLQIGPWIDSLLRPWQWIYQERRVTVTDATGGAELTLPAPVWLRQVTRVLLQNAFRHGDGDIAIALERHEHAGRTGLRIVIRNPAYASVAAGVQGAGVAVAVPVGPRAQAGTRLGLTHARRLAQALGGTLSTTSRPSGTASHAEADPLHDFCAELFWPIASDPVNAP